MKASFAIDEFENVYMIMKCRYCEVNVFINFIDLKKVKARTIFIVNGQ